MISKEALQKLIDDSPVFKIEDAEPAKVTENFFELRDDLPQTIAKGFEEYSRTKADPVMHRFNVIDGWSIYHNGRYQKVIDISEIEDHLSNYLDQCRVLKNDTLIPIKITTHVLNNVIKQLRRLDGVKLSPKQHAPCYLGDNPNWPEKHTDVLVMNNCILDNRQYPPKVLDQTPDYYTFNTYPINYNYEARNKIAVFDRFIVQLFADRDFEQPNPDDSRACLEMMAILMVGELREQRIFGLTGPTRCGKGTIVHILEQLIPNHAKTSLSELGGSHGMENLVGRTLAISADEKNKHFDRNIGVTVGRLKALSGGLGSINVNAKNIKIKELPILCNFLFCSNEVLELPDSSGTIADRFYYLRMNISYLGREDKELYSKLDQELEGIFVVLLQAYHEYKKRGKLLETEGGKQAQDEIRDEANKLMPFLRACCEFDAEFEIDIEDLTKAYNAWADKQDLSHKNSKWIGKHLSGASQTTYPMVNKKRQNVTVSNDDVTVSNGILSVPSGNVTVSNDENKRVKRTVYTGIKVLDDFWDNYKLSQDNQWDNYTRNYNY